MIELTPWPAELAARYRAKGYWTGQPLNGPVEAQAAARPEAVAVICGDRQVTYAQLYSMVADIVSALLLNGFKPGDRVGAYCSNCIVCKPSIYSPHPTQCNQMKCFGNHMSIHSVPMVAFDLFFASI